MLQLAEPHHTIMRHMDNCRFLHDTVFDYADRHPEQLMLSEYHSRCGTLKCILGWYEQLRYGNERPLTQYAKLLGAGTSASRDIFHNAFAVTYPP